MLKRPLLIVPPWINKFYILDLNPEKSFIRWCVEQGHTVFVISWVNPDQPPGAARASSTTCARASSRSLDVIERGDRRRRRSTPSAIASAARCCRSRSPTWPRTGDKRIKSATLFATQVDFTHAGDLKVFVDEEQIASVEKKMDVRGYLEGQQHGRRLQHAALRTT